MIIFSDYESVILDCSSVFKSEIKQETYDAYVISRETRIENK